MDEIKQCRYDRIRARQLVVDQDYYRVSEARNEAMSRYREDPSSANRQDVLKGVRATIDVLEELYALDLHVAQLGRGIDEEWDRAARDGIAATDTRLMINFGYLTPDGGYGLTLADL